MLYIIGLWAIGLVIAGLVLYGLRVVFLAAEGWVTIRAVLFIYALYSIGIGIVGMSILTLVGIATLGYAARNG